MFENLDKDRLVDNQGRTYPEFRKALTPRYGVAWLHICLAWAVLAGTMAGIILLSGLHLLSDILLIPVGALVFGFTLAFLQLFLHEAAHYNLHPKRSTNDWLNDIFVSGITGFGVKRYRPIHWDHHRYLGTPMDTEITYFDPLNIRFLVEALLGIRAIKVIGLRQSKKKQSDQEGGGGAMLLTGLVINLLIFGCLLYLGQWPAAIDCSST